MLLSERGALKAAVCDGGYHIYPGAGLISYIKDHLPDENFKGNFDPVKTTQKVRSINIIGDEHTKAVLKEDLALLCKRLEKMDANYDIESVFAKMGVDLPKMAKRYFNIDNYKPVNTQVIEYYFEGFNDIYKDADWIAFNIDPAESKEYNVPIGIYFKKSQVSPGYPEYVVMHENVHQFTAPAGMDEKTHYYIPWIMEGFADVIGYLMLYRITKDWGLVTRTKNAIVEFDVIDSRKATYHYESAIASRFISTAGLPLTKAFLVAMKKYRHNFDWNAVANTILRGNTAMDSILSGYNGTNKNTLKSELLMLEKEYKNDGSLDEDDMVILRYFSLTQPPSTLNPPEYRTAVWFMNALEKETEQHHVHTKYLGSKYASEGDLVQIKKIGKAEWEKVPKGHGSFLVCKDAIPSSLHEAAEKLGNYFFVVKKEFGGKAYFDVFGGGLPYRMGTGEIRCAIKN